MTNGVSTVMALIAIVGVVVLAAVASSNVLDKSVNSLMGGNDSKGIINSSENLSYGESGTLPSSTAVEKLTVIHEERA
jgi:hypothetical protein